MLHFDGRIAIWLGPRQGCAQIMAGRGTAMSRNAKPRQPTALTELPAELTQARRFGKARSARSGALSEDYVELIADLLATSGPYRGVFLTEEGHKSAARVRARHRLFVEVLLSLGVPAQSSEADAEG